MTTEHQYLTFFVGTQRYAVDVHQVGEIIHSQPVAGALWKGGPVLGALTFRGKTLRVLSASKRFKVADTDESKFIILSDGTLALAVTDVDTVTTHREELQRHSLMSSDRVVHGVLNTPTGLIVVIRPEYLLPPGLADEDTP